MAQVAGYDIEPLETSATQQMNGYDIEPIDAAAPSAPKKKPTVTVPEYGIPEAQTASYGTQEPLWSRAGAPVARVLGSALTEGTHMAGNVLDRFGAHNTGQSMIGAANQYQNTAIDPHNEHPIETGVGTFAGGLVPMLAGGETIGAMLPELGVAAGYGAKALRAVAANVPTMAVLAEKGQALKQAGIAALMSAAGPAVEKIMPYAEGFWPKLGQQAAQRTAAGVIAGVPTAMMGGGGLQTGLNAAFSAITHSPGGVPEGSPELPYGRPSAPLGQEPQFDLQAPPPPLAAQGAIPGSLGPQMRPEPIIPSEAPQVLVASPVAVPAAPAMPSPLELAAATQRTAQPKSKQKGVTQNVQAEQASPEIGPQAVGERSLEYAQGPSNGETGNGLEPSQEELLIGGEGDNASPSQVFPVNSAPLEGGSKIVSADTEPSLNAAQGTTLTDKRFGEFDVPSQRMMMSAMLARIHDPEIRNEIVKFIPVDVVDNLATIEPSSKMVFHDENMLGNSPVVKADNAVSIGINTADSLMRVMTRLTTKRSGAIPLLAIPPSEADATMGADSGEASAGVNAGPATERLPSALSGKSNPAIFANVGNHEALDQPLIRKSTPKTQNASRYRTQEVTPIDETALPQATENKTNETPAVDSGVFASPEPTQADMPEGIVLKSGKYDTGGRGDAYEIGDPKTQLSTMWYPGKETIQEAVAKLKPAQAAEVNLASRSPETQTDIEDLRDFPKQIQEIHNAETAKKPSLAKDIVAEHEARLKEADQFAKDLFGSEEAAPRQTGGKGKAPGGLAPGRGQRGAIGVPDLGAMADKIGSVETPWTRTQKIMDKTPKTRRVMERFQKSYNTSAEIAGPELKAFEEAQPGLFNYKQKAALEKSFMQDYREGKPMPNAKTQKLADAWRKSADKILRRAMADGVMIHDPSVEGGERPIGPTQTNYIPDRMYSEEAHNALQAQAGPVWEAWVREASRNGKQRPPSPPPKALPGEDPILARQRIEMSMEMARKGWVPPDGYLEVNGKRVKIAERDPLKVIPRWINGWADRLAVIEHWGGQKGASYNADAVYKGLKRQDLIDQQSLGALANPMGSPAKTGPAEQFKALWEDLNRRHRASFLDEMTTPAGNAVRAGEGYVRASQLSTSVLRHLGPYAAVAKLGARAFKNYLKSVGNSAAQLVGIPTKFQAEIDFAREMDAIARDPISSNYTTSDLVNSAKTANDVVNFITGRTWQLRRLNEAAAISGKEVLVKAVNYLRNPGDNILRRAWGEDQAGTLPKLKDLRFSKNDIARRIKDGVTNSDMGQAMRVATETTNLHNETALTRRPWMSGDVWGRLWRYGAYQRMTGNILSDSIKEVRHGNIAPVVRILVAGGLTIGPAQHLVRQWVFQTKKKDDPSFLNDTAKATLELIGNGMLEVGAGGIPQMMADDAYYSAKNREVKLGSFPQLEFVGKLGSGFLQWAAAEAEKNPKIKAEMVKIGLSKSPKAGAWGGTVQKKPSQTPSGIAYKTAVKNIPLARAVDAQAHGPVWQQANQPKRKGAWSN